MVAFLAGTVGPTTLMLPGVQIHTRIDGQTLPNVLSPCYMINNTCKNTEVLLHLPRSAGSCPFEVIPYTDTHTQTHTHTDGSVFITWTADAGGNKTQTNGNIYVVCQC